MILRAEKGFIVVGKDTDGTTMPHDLGVTGPRDSRKDEYIGKRSLSMPVAVDPRRKQLLGLSVARRRNAAADRRACDVRRGSRAALAGLRHVELFQSEPRPPDRAWPHRSGLVAHGRNGQRLSSRRRAARDHREPGRARSGRKAAPCVRWIGRRPRGDASFSLTANA